MLSLESSQIRRNHNLLKSLSFFFSPALRSRQLPIRTLPSLGRRQQLTPLHVRGHVNGRCRRRLVVERIMRKATLIISAAAAIAAIAVVAWDRTATKIADPDWKIFGGQLRDNGFGCFYDANTIAIPTRTIRQVWTKCIRVDNIADASRASNPSQNIIKEDSHYIPPIATVIDTGAFMDGMLIAYETIADADIIKPYDRSLVEIDCSHQKLRHLSSYENTNGHESSDQQLTEWQSITPKTPASTLLKLLCLPQRLTKLNE